MTSPTIADILQAEWKGNQRLGDPAAPSGSQASPQAPTGLGLSVSIPIAQHMRDILVGVSEAALDQTIIDLADHQGVSRHDTAQTGWFACWQQVHRRLMPLTTAQGIEALGRDPSSGLDAKHESPVPERDAP